MRTLIYFTRALPGISEDLNKAGFQVYEALAISEVFYLMEQHPTASITVDSTVEHEAAQQVALHYPTVRMKADATPADLVRELAALSPDSTLQ